MTNVNTNHPNHIPHIELTEQGRKIDFRKDCLTDIKIYRKVDEQQDWELLIKGIRPPYVDEEVFPPGTRLSYSIVLAEDTRFELEVRL